MTDETKELHVAQKPTEPKLIDVKFIIIDTETTGPDPKNDEVVEYFARGWTLHPKRRFGATTGSYVDSLCKIPPGAAAVHHITSDMIVGFDPLEKCLPKILNFVEDMPILAYNSDFDQTILGRHIPRFSENDKTNADALFNKEWLDVKKLAMKAWHIGEKNKEGFALENYQLQTLRYWANVPKLDPNMGAAHSAAADTAVTGFIFKAAIKKLILDKKMSADCSYAEFKKFYDQPIEYVTIPYGTQKGKRPEELEPAELKKFFDPLNKFYEIFKKDGILDWLGPYYQKMTMEYFGKDRPIPAAKKRSVLGTN